MGSSSGSSAAAERVRRRLTRRSACWLVLGDSPSRERLLRRGDTARAASLATSLAERLFIAAASMAAGQVDTPERGGRLYNGSSSLLARQLDGDKGTQNASVLADSRIQALGE